MLLTWKQRRFSEMKSAVFFGFPFLGAFLGEGISISAATDIHTKASKSRTPLKKNGTTLGKREVPLLEPR
ncbi:MULTISPECIES: hypothetical protein [unclassified Pseudomonas]|uniref:hypothetical protein n=1 Tax=unclassified Pseudomonas TaxID=196821 RepID=UPI0011142D77|nr:MULTISPECIES: hypothetical protein [unclassified Pseudomonas]